MKHLVTFLCFGLIGACGPSGTPTTPARSDSHDQPPNAPSKTPAPDSNLYKSVSIAKGKWERKLIGIGANDHWYPLLAGGNRNTAIVNASNEDVAFSASSGGLNRGLYDYFMYKNPASTGWGDLFFKDDSKRASESVSAGSFVYSKHVAPIEFDWQIHAVGPRESNFKDDVYAARALITGLVYDMLIFARDKQINTIVIHAIATNIFAKTNDFKAQMYEGLADGIFKFIKENGSATKPDKILLNSWDNKVGGKANPGIVRLEAQTVK